MLRRAFVVSSLAIAALILVALGDAFGQNTSATSSPISKFVGTWKEDLSKRKGSFQMLTFRQNANGGLEELRGSELRPLVQPVNFTGKPYAIDDSKNQIAWKQIDSNRFERQIFSGSRLLNTRRIQVSADGKTLTEETESVEPKGEKTISTTIFRRASGDRGLVGLWKPESTKTNTPQEVVYEAIGANGLKITTRSGNSSTVTAMLDNKPVPLVGDAVISGTMTAVRRVTDSTLEFTNSREGTVTGRSVRVVSPDGKTLTVTTTQLGPNASKEPQVLLYIKQ